MEKHIMRLLIIEDCPADLLLMKRILRTMQDTTCEITEAASGVDGIAEFQLGEDLDCVILDYALPDMTGLEVLSELAKLPAFTITPVVMVTGQGNERVAVQAMKLGAFDYFIKGEISQAAMLRVITNALDKRGMNMRLIEEAALRAAAEMELEAIKLRNAELEGIQRTIVTVSHEINNPLAGLAANLQLLNESRQRNDHHHQEMLAECLCAALRIRDVIKRLEQVKEPMLRSYAGKYYMLDIRNTPDAE